MKGKRDRLEVIFDILSIIKKNDGCIKPTPLLRFSNLSYYTFNRYFDDLISKNFIEEVLDNKGKKQIKITNKGEEYLQTYKSIRSFIQEFDLE